MMRFTLSGTAALLSVVAGTSLTGVASAQSSESTFVATGHPQRDTLARLVNKPVTVEFKEHRLEEVIRFVAELTGADIEPLWIDDSNPQGLDKDKQITLKANGISALKLLERVLEKAVDNATTKADSATWQLTEGGALQIGPRARLNKDHRLEIYDIRDLLLVVPEFGNAPQFDLSSVLQNSGGGGGGGGGQSPFKDNNQSNRGAGGRTTIGNADIPSVQERADELIKIIQDSVETEQWVEGGGEGGTIKFYAPGSIIVNAADYMHRQINGYPYWPQRLTNASLVGGRRYVTMNGTTSTNKLNGFTNQPVTGTTGGPPGGGK